MDEETQMQTTGPMEVAPSEPNPTVQIAASQPIDSQNTPTVPAPASTGGISAHEALDALKHHRERGFRRMIHHILGLLEMEAVHIGKDISAEIHSITAKLGL
ncbi:hypothetical protein BH10PLA2_BH10PLA2_00830 [soil metagenome]